jgi:hypothetical protein
MLRPAPNMKVPKHRVAAGGLTAEVGATNLHGSGSVSDLARGFDEPGANLDLVFGVAPGSAVPAGA